MKIYSRDITTLERIKGCCISYRRLDGTRFTIYPRKRSLRVFINEVEVVDSTPFYSKILRLIDPYREFLYSLYKHIDEPTVYAELAGPNSFVGRHNLNDEHNIYFLAAGGSQYLIPPDNFLELFQNIRKPLIIYKGEFSENYISMVRRSYRLPSGVLCYTTEDRKFLYDIKTEKYFRKLKLTFNENWIQYW